MDRNSKLQSNNVRMRRRLHTQDLAHSMSRNDCRKLIRDSDRMNILSVGARECRDCEEHLNVEFKGEDRKLNPLHWKKEHQIAFLAATAVGAGMGIFIALKQAVQSSMPYWLYVILWGAGGAALAGLGAYFRQIIRNRNSR